MAAGVSKFSRTLAPLNDQSSIISLTTSGFTVLPWNYDAAVAPPRLDSVVNAADFTQPVAPGGLIRLSVGVEPAADLIADIDEALGTLEAP